MCGIFAYFCYHYYQTNEKLIKMAKMLEHRGPEHFGFTTKICEKDNLNQSNVFLAHNRLSIIDPNGGHQPLTNTEKTLYLTINGEIFNYKELKLKYSKYAYQTNSDCEVILALYYYYTNSGTELITKEQVISMLEELNGQFSFVLYDKNRNIAFIARDPYGITSLFHGKDELNQLVISSEVKAMKDINNCYVFEPGFYMVYDISKNRQLAYENYFKYCSYGKWSANISILEQHPHCKNTTLILSNIHDIFVNAVEKRMMADVPFGVLLSGGLDSSLVASIASIKMKENQAKYNIVDGLHTFSIGLPGAPDLEKARIVADFIGSNHHEFQFTIEEAWKVIENVIYTLETYDITTIRASTPMWLMSKKIRELGFKMVLSGEGSDELLGGYLYFHAAPNNEAHQKECKRRLLELGYFDCLRADKSTMAHSVEVRVPFLDVDIVDYCVNIPMEVKCQKGMEKYIFRKAFDVKNEYGKPRYLPDEILWRQKEQFSDGVGYAWIDFLRDFTSKLVSDEEMATASSKYPYNTPSTKEALFYRKIFEKLFTSRRASIVRKWVPNTDWAGVAEDPSGRYQKTHINKLV
jgi:asparagine synthase (glutamine-hydrolysing)